MIEAIFLAIKLVNKYKCIVFVYRKYLQMALTQNIKYRVRCEIHKLKINKNIDFETKIIWKRHQNKTQTSSVKHTHGYSIFDEELTLDFNLAFNSQTRLFEQKNTEIVAVIVYQDKIKSGGYVKYNIADNLNTNPNGISRVTIPLTQCPDPAAFIQASFSYQKISEEIDPDEMSVLNASSRDLNMSRVDFHDDKLSLEMERINETIKKFESLASLVKKKGKDSGKKLPELMTRIQILEGDKKALQANVTKLQKQLKEKEQLLNLQKKNNRKERDELEKQLEKRSKELKSAKSIDQRITPDYKELYEAAMKEVEELRSGDAGLRKSLDFRFSSQMEDVREIADFGGKEEDDGQKMEQLTRQNVELQSQVASMSHKLAQLFNASYDYGGAKLLDHLQTSIGLTESNQ